MISTTDNQGDSFSDSHAADPAFMRQIQRDSHRFRGHKGNPLLHRARGYPGFSGQDAPIGNKSTEAEPWQLLSNILLILCQICNGLQSPCIQISIV